MSLQKPKLFETQKSFIAASLFLMFLLSVHLVFQYQAYKEFVSKPFYFTEASVLSAYEKEKKGKTYTVLKLRSKDGYTFYTTSYKREHFLQTDVRVQIFPNESISFTDFLGTFYVKSRIKKVTKSADTMKSIFLNRIAIQHETQEMQDFYNAIFFATPLNKTLREKIALLGVSHLVALSGFHLSILWALLYALLLLPYRFFQQKYFPYRHALFDVGLLTMTLLGLYLFFVDFPPSLVRAYAMVFSAWLLLILGVELLSFKFLTGIVLLLLALFPSLLVSLGFWLSVSGVFYIFLLLHYSKNYPAWVISLLFIPVGIFIMMLPLVHSIFSVTSPFQLLSPLLSLLFIPFYPLSMFLHLVGQGDVFDTPLLWLFSLPSQNSEQLLPLWATVFYVLLSLLSVFSNKAFVLLLTIAVLYGATIFSVEWV